MFVWLGAREVGAWPPRAGGRVFFFFFHSVGGGVPPAPPGGWVFSFYCFSPSRRGGPKPEPAAIRRPLGFLSVGLGRRGGVAPRVVPPSDCLPKTKQTNGSKPVRGRPRGRPASTSDAWRDGFRSPPLESRRRLPRRLGLAGHLESLQIIPSNVNRCPLAWGPTSCTILRAPFGSGCTPGSRLPTRSRWWQPQKHRLAAGQHLRPAMADLAFTECCQRFRFATGRRPPPPPQPPLRPSKTPLPPSPSRVSPCVLARPPVWWLFFRSRPSSPPRRPRPPPRRPRPTGSGRGERVGGVWRPGVGGPATGVGVFRRVFFFPPPFFWPPPATVLRPRGLLWPGVCRWPSAPSGAPAPPPAPGPATPPPPAAFTPRGPPRPGVPARPPRLALPPPGAPLLPAAPRLPPRGFAPPPLLPPPSPLRFFRPPPRPCRPPPLPALPGSRPFPRHPRSAPGVSPGGVPRRAPPFGFLRAYQPPRPRCSPPPLSPPPPRPLSPTRRRPYCRFFPRFFPPPVGLAVEGAPPPVPPAPVIAGLGLRRPPGAPAGRPPPPPRLPPSRARSFPLPRAGIFNFSVWGFGFAANAARLLGRFGVLRRAPPRALKDLRPLGPPAAPPRPPPPPAPRRRRPPLPPPFVWSGGCRDVRGGGGGGASGLSFRGARRAGARGMRGGASPRRRVPAPPPPPGAAPPPPRHHQAHQTLSPGPARLRVGRGVGGGLFFFRRGAPPPHRLIPFAVPRPRA